MTIANTINHQQIDDKQDSFCIYIKELTFKSHLRYIGGVAVRAINSSFNFISSLNLGYSSNLSARPTSRIKF